MSKDVLSKRILFYSRCKGPERVCSNFYVCEPPLLIDGKTFATVEHYFQSAKFADAHPDYAERIRKATTPLKAKHMGSKRCTSKLGLFFDAITWNEHKAESVMSAGIRCKADQCKEFADFLREHKDCEFVENSPFDNVWGCGRSGKGQNKLGKIIASIAKSL